MRDRVYLVSVVVGAAVLSYLGRDLLAQSATVTWGLTFAGTTAAAVLGMALYRVQLELRASRHELARKEAEISFALEVQRALLPRQFPTDSGLEFAAVCVPARGISGDYYDILTLPGGRVGFAVADISGKGISAAILMSNLQAVLRMLADSGQPLDTMCPQLNRHLHRVTEGFRFATFFYGEWSSVDRRLSYVNAGHTVPLLCGSARGKRLTEGGPPLGAFQESEYQVSQVGLHPGDLVVLYSDGITEAGAHQGHEFGESRLEAIVSEHVGKPLDRILREVVDAVRAWSGTEIDDDMTILLVRVAEPAKEET